MAKAPTLFKETEDGDVEIALPFRWEICGHCQGHGKTSEHVECDGGGFTSSEWAEQDEDFRHDYIAGRYDRASASCGGAGKVQVADLDKLSEEDRKLYEEQLRGDAEIEEIHRMERLMGA